MLLSFPGLGAQRTSLSLLHLPKEADTGPSPEEIQAIIQKYSGRRGRLERDGRFPRWAETTERRPPPGLAAVRHGWLMYGSARLPADETALYLQGRRVETVLHVRCVVAVRGPAMQNATRFRRCTGSICVDATLE